MIRNGLLRFRRYSAPVFVPPQRSRPDRLRSLASTVWCAAAALLLSAPVHAELYCVDTELELATALAAAAASSEDDTIRIRTGSYGGLGAIELEVRGALTISGGWGATCLSRSETAVTAINGLADDNFDLTQDGSDLELLGLTFSGWSQVILSDVQQPFGPPVDEIRVRRSRFTGGLMGLFINAGSHDILVENSLFDGHSNTGLQIYRTSGSFGSAEVLLHYNTITSPSVSTASGLRVQAADDAAAADIDIYNTVMDGHSFDLRLSNQPVRVRNSSWTTQLFTAPGGLAGGSGGNLSGNPQLDMNFRPIEPTSPLINAGITLVGATPSTDYDGGPRVFGIRPDIGAYESGTPGTTVITVTSATDSGAGSLRSAIGLANGAAGDAIINFNIPGACPHEIPVDSALPTIAKTVRIEGYSQPGSVESTDPAIFDGTVCIFLNGGGDVTGGLSLVTDSPTDEPYVSGLGFYGFTAHAILLAGPGRGQIRGNLFGTGLPLIGGGFDDAAIRVVAASGSVIGGDSVSDRNVIGAAAQVGIRIDGAGARTVRYNLIGTDRSGGSLGNGIGIRVADGDGDVIRNNAIAFNDAQGILLADGANAPQNTEINSNRIGASPVNAATGGNGGNGIRVTGGDGHEIRNNLINNNDTDGIAVLAPSRRVWMVSNRFVNNARLPVDLSPDGRNFNDLDVGQTGANDRQNFPALFDSGGQPTVGSTRVQLSSANGAYVAQIFLSERCTGLGAGSGDDDAAALVGTSDLLILSCAGPTFNCTDSIVVPISTAPNYPFTGKFLSAVVWDEEHNTSEYSVCYPYEVADEVFGDGFE
jgi:hypothetical protein